MKNAIIIPALNPEENLMNLICKLQKLSDATIIIVDDGSDEEFQPLFTKLQNINQCIVSHHATNMGKGTAIKTGIRVALQCYPELTGIVTADADGQHLPKDVLKISNALDKNSSSLILGIRDFSEKDVPFKSRWGNHITSAVFRMSTKVHCPDTQTGLRGIPASLFDFCLAIPGKRYEYEMNMLTAAAKTGIPLVLLPIATVYIENNRASHFNAIKDSARIYFDFFKFGISSTICAATDLSVFTLLTAFLFGRSSVGILSSTVIARCLSGTLNFTLNKKWCFKNHEKTFRQALEYFVLFCTQMLLSWAIVTMLSALPVNLTLLKMLADGILFIFSYSIQSNLIFKEKSQNNQVSVSGPAER